MVSERILSHLSRLPHLPPPVLTAYLDVNPASPRNQGQRGYVTWLVSTGRALGKQMSARDRKLFRTQLERVENYLRTARPRARGLAVFAGPDIWQTIPLQVDVTEELHWGKPSLEQMLWVLDEHQPRGVVVIEGTKARFFILWLGTISEDAGAAFEVDIAPGRKRKLVGSPRPGVFGQVGVARDFAKDHLMAQRSHFARELAQRIASWSEANAISPIALVGAGDVGDMVLDAMPAHLRKQVMLIRKALPKVTPAEVQAALGPALRTWERNYEESVVRDLIAAQDSGVAVLGWDRVLTALQDGHVRELVVARGMSGSLRQCARCGRADRSADPVCVLCGGERRLRTVRTLLPELVSLHGASVEIVAGKAAKDLRAVGGIGAWLRSDKPSHRSITHASPSISGPSSATSTRERQGRKNVSPASNLSHAG